MDLHAIELGKLGQQLQVHAVVVVDKRDFLAVVTALRDVMRHCRDDDPRDAWHVIRMTERPELVNRNRWLTPYFTSALCLVQYPALWLHTQQSTPLRRRVRGYENGTQ